MEDLFLCLSQSFSAVLSSKWKKPFKIIKYGSSELFFFFFYSWGILCILVCRTLQTSKMAAFMLQDLRNGWNVCSHGTCLFLGPYMSVFLGHTVIWRVSVCRVTGLLFWLMQKIKLLVGVPAEVLNALLLIQLANVLGKAVDDSPSILDPAICVGELCKWGSWLLVSSQLL